MAEVYGSQRRPRKRWGRRLLITFIVLLIIVGGILVVADRLGASYAERVISDRVAQQVANRNLDDLGTALSQQLEEPHRR